MLLPLACSTVRVSCGAGAEAISGGGVTNVFGHKLIRYTFIE